MPKIITISTSKVIGDKSYSHNLYVVVNENKTHLRVKVLGKGGSGYWRGIHTIEKDEYDICDAVGMATPEEFRQALIFEQA